MRVVVLVLSVFVAAMGALAIFTPGATCALARAFANRGGLYAATAIRLALGAGLLMVADTSRVPVLIRVLGAIILIIGIMMPFIGLDRHRRMIDWWFSLGRIVQIIWGMAAFALGLFLINAIR